MRVALGSTLGWVLLMAEFGLETFLRRNEPGFAPEVGPMGSFIIFGALISVYYIVGIGTMLCAAFAMRWRRREATRAVVFGLGAGVCLLAVSLAGALTQQTVSDTEFVLVLMVLPALVAAYVVSWQSRLRS